MELAKFNLNQLLNGGAKQGGGETRSTNPEYNITHIPVSKLEPSQDNFYSVEQIEELKASIAAFGIKQNLIVAPTANDSYRVIAGHRRRLAVLSLVEEGKTEFERVPCIIESEDDELRERLLLITTNSTTRVLSDWEKINQAKELREILGEIKKRDKIPGRLRDLIASTLDTSPAQIGRMEAIDKNLTPEFKEELKEGRVNLSTAYEISGMPEEKQKEVYEDYQQQGSISIKEAKEAKQSALPEPPERDTNQPAPEVTESAGEAESEEEETEEDEGEPEREPPVEEAPELPEQQNWPRAELKSNVIKPQGEWKLEEVWVARDDAGNIIRVSDHSPEDLRAIYKSFGTCSCDTCQAEEEGKD
jgi:ParB family chromosome partitioning protein